MIDIEIPVFNAVYDAVQGEYPSCAIYNDRPQSMVKFPAVVLVEQDNTRYPEGVLPRDEEIFLVTRFDDVPAEKYAEIMYQVDIFCDDQKGAKTKCKSIAALVDSVLTGLNFNRMSLSPMPNTDPNIIRYTGRYRAVVSAPKVTEHENGLPDYDYILYRR